MPRGQWREAVVELNGKVKAGIEGRSFNRNGMGVSENGRKKKGMRGDEMGSEEKRGVMLSG